MYGQSLVLFALLALQRCVEAGKTEELCFTQRTSPSPRTPVRTVSHLETIVFTRPIVVTTTPGTTVTPATVTFTTTETVTTTSTSPVPQVTDTFTDTQYTDFTSTLILPTSTETDSTTVTITTTSTAPGATTVPTPAGFTPVLDTLPTSGAKKKRSAGSGSLLAAVQACAAKQQLCHPLPGKGKPFPKSWPAAVTCVGLVETVKYKTTTRTAKKTTTVTAPTPSTTITVTSTVTVTQPLITPDASTTITVTSTNTIPTTITPMATITNTDTATATATTYTATAYAQCLDNSQNYAGSLSGYGIEVNYDEGNSPAVITRNTNDNTKEGCCNSCAANPLCTGSSFYGGFQPGQQCYVFNTPDSSCSAGEFNLGAAYSTSLPADDGYFVSNGNCGFFDVNAGAYS